MLFPYEATDILEMMVVIKQEGKGPVAKLVEQECTAAFDALLDQAQLECPMGVVTRP